MRLFQRIGDIIAANLNDLVDRFEDPEVMLKQAIREMDAMIEGATAGAARHRGATTPIERPDRPRAKRRRRARGPRRCRGGDDDLARQAIARAHEHEAMAQALASGTRRPRRRRRSFAARLPR